MRAADQPVQRPRHAKILTVDEYGEVRHLERSRIAGVFRRGDLVVANDAATMPASLSGLHLRTAEAIEVRLAARRSLAADSIARCTAVAFGAGDYRIRTEDRPLPPEMRPGDRLALGPLRASVVDLAGHPRLVRLAFDGSVDEIWEGIARHGRPIQYSHVKEPLALWDVWTPIAGPPVAFEPPSAGFVLDWSILAALRSRKIPFATITHAAGISSTGDADLDKRLPFDEHYFIPAATALAIRCARARGGRVIAIGTTVVRALEHAAADNGLVRAGSGVADEKITSDSTLQVVDAILSGTHEPGTSHYELLRAFVDDATLRLVDRELNLGDYRTHEFGDSVFVERNEARGALIRERSAA